MRGSEEPRRKADGRRGPRAGSGARDTPGPPRGSRDGGYVTAEAAIALPVLALFTLMLIWGLMAAAAQLQCVDAARAGARAAARSEPGDAAVAAAKSAAPHGARVEVWRDGDLVRVRVEARSAGPGPLAVGLRGEAVALAEDAVGAPPGSAAVRGAVP
ncbi:TadE family type IV pilus minor pilin [Streptomyces cucumeris]|uniref:TadE family type IV pilus minor pilin n=1 Tax=Streptomyces cucumeris TaxID=2962890 RepID=UPI003EC032E0